MDRRFTIDESRIVHEALEDEVVIVNLDSGHYYMLEGSAPAIWALLAGGASVGEAVRALAASGDEASVLEAVSAFADDLVREGLLTAAEADDPPAAPARDPVASPTAAFTPPIMYRYTDMATLIQMDPIRDFDETGWPRRRTPPAP
jgi:hypothetical protein